MFRHLLINTIASAGSFITISIVGFLLVPVLVATYGLKEFGFIVLARLFLPTGILVLFDFGFSELAAQAVARARETKAWREAGVEFSMLLALASPIGVALSLALLAGADQIARLLGADDGSGPGGGFAGILRATGLALPPLFVVAVLEGVVKGYGAFRSLRLIEAACALAYGVVALVLAINGWSYASVAYAFLVLTLVKGALVAANAVRAGLGRELRLRPVDRFALQDILPRCTSMAQNRLLGAMQGPAQQPLIGLFIGPTAVAMFEVLTKLPRFCKAAIGLLGSALIPVAARLDAKNDAARVGELASWGMLLSVVAATPPLAGAALLSEPLLRLWAGPTFAAFWQWHALMFVVPMAGVLSGFGATALIVRPHALFRMNLISAVQLAGQLVIALALLRDLQERAFLLAQALAGSAAVIFLLRLMIREHRLQADLLWRVLGALAVGVLLAVLYRAVGDPRAIQSWTSLCSHFALWCLIYWCGLWYLVLQGSERARLWELFRSFLVAPGANARSRT